MADTPAPKLTETIFLTVPIVMAGENGSNNTIGSLTVKRPKTRHIKQVAALVGPAAVQALFDGKDDVSRDDIVKALTGLLTSDQLDGATKIVADLCSVSPSAIDELDPVDLPALVSAVMGFFPALPSIGSLSS